MRDLSGARERPDVRRNREEGPPEYCIFCAPSKVRTADDLWGPKYPLVIDVYDPDARYCNTLTRRRPLACKGHVEEMDWITRYCNGMATASRGLPQTYVRPREDGMHLHCAASLMELASDAESMRQRSQRRLEPGHDY